MPTKAPAPAGGVSVLLQNSGYENWGRPIGMDVQGAGCGGFNNSRPVRKFNISARVTNNGDAPIKATDWYMAIKKADGSNAYVCYYGYTGGQSFPEIPAKSMRDVTFAAFIELNESISRAYIFLRDGAVSNALVFK